MVPNSLTFQNHTFTNEMDIAHAFNKRFTSVADRYLARHQSNISNSTDFTALQQFINSKMPPGNSFKIPRVSEEFVGNFLLKVDVKKPQVWIIYQQKV